MSDSVIVGRSSARALSRLECNIVCRRIASTLPAISVPCDFNPQGLPLGDLLGGPALVGFEFADGDDRAADPPRQQLLGQIERLAAPPDLVDNIHNSGKVRYTVGDWPGHAQ
jgi:hypothetical protein